MTITSKNWSEQELDGEILAAHAASDIRRLAELYRQASIVKEELGEHDAAGFLLVQAYVFAIDCGHQRADDWRLLLAAQGREV